MLLGVGIVALVVIAAGIWLAVRPARGPEMSATAPRLSIVVLPFANLSGDPAQDYLADVITEELTTGLSRISGTFVIARSTAFTYKGKPLDVKQIGRDLNVRYVLEGSEQHSGNQVRVNAQLIDVETGAHLWADQFDADRGDLLKMQDEIVTRLARAMQIQLVAVDAARVTRTRPGNLDAEDLALRCQAGVYNSVGPAEFAAALSLCDRALNIDNRNVLALSILAMMHIIPVVEARSTDPQADIRQADELVSRALALDPNFYAAHFAKAYVLMGQNRTQEAVIEGERSLALNPSFIEAYVALCAANNFLGRPDRALELADKAIRLSPRDPSLRFLYHMKGWALFMKQQDDQAIEWLRRAEGGTVFTELILASALALTGTGRSPRDAKTLLNDDRRHHHNDRPTEKAAVVVGRQSDMGGIQRAPLRGPAQSGHAGRMSARCSQAASSSSKALASLRSSVSNPSVNQPYTGAEQYRGPHPACSSHLWLSLGRRRPSVMRNSILGNARPGSTAMARVPTVTKPNRR